MVRGIERDAAYQVHYSTKGKRVVTLIIDAEACTVEALRADGAKLVQSLAVALAKVGDVIAAEAKTRQELPRG